MNSQICKCCGQPVAETKDALARNPNICVQCLEAEQLKVEPAPPELGSTGESETVKTSESGQSAFAM